MSRAAKLQRIATQVRKWHLGMVTPPHPTSVTEPQRVTFANMRRGARGGRLHNVRRYSLSLLDLMALAELVRIPVHPARVNLFLRGSVHSDEVPRHDLQCGA